MRKLIILSLFMFAASLNAAVDAKQFENKQKEQIYNSLIDELRCLVCQNQTIAHSNAALAQDLRRQVYEMIQKGQSKQEIANYMLERYGDFVLYNPPLKSKTVVLWVGPAVFLLLGISVVFFYAKRKNKQTTPELTEEQQQKMHALLEKGENSES